MIAEGRRPKLILPQFLTNSPIRTDIWLIFAHGAPSEPSGRRPPAPRIRERGKKIAFFHFAGRGSPSRISAPVVVHVHLGGVRYEYGQEESRMVWTKPEFKEVAVTLEVTAYTARK